MDYPARTKRQPRAVGCVRFRNSAFAAGKHRSIASQQTAHDPGGNRGIGIRQPVSGSEAWGECADQGGNALLRLCCLAEKCEQWQGEIAGHQGGEW